MSTEYISWIAMIIAVAAAVTLIILYKRGIIDKELLGGAADVIEEIPVIDGGESLFDLIMKYSRTAVLAVNQLVQAGKISKDNDERKEAAMKIVYNAATVDGIDMGEKEQKLADDCIEASVYEAKLEKAKNNE